jgi:hypothetical protein
MEVPLSAMYPVEELSIVPEKGTVETTLTPGAEISGLIRVSELVPRELKDASLPLLSIAPTVMTFGSIPGEATVPKVGPLFPAATTTTIPASTALSTAKHIGSSFSPGPPRLMLMISAWSMVFPSEFGSIAASIPAITSLVLPEPSLPSTLYASIFASGATPDDPPDAAIIPAT